jgi:hypothetical protein
MNSVWLAFFTGSGIGFFFAIFLIGIVELVMHEKKSNRFFFVDNWEKVKTQFLLSIILFLLMVIFVYLS